MSYQKSNLGKGEVFLMQDIAIISLSVLVAVFLVKTNVLSEVLLTTQELHSMGSFIAGIFFTSVFTTAPAIATLGHIAKEGSIINNAFFGAFGAVLGDIIIFQFIKDKLSEHFLDVVGHNGLWKRIHALFKLKYFRWITFLVGGLLIASPLPDELGIGLLGFSKMKLKQFVPLSLFFNFIGIVLIGIVARTI